MYMHIHGLHNEKNWQKLVNDRQQTIWNNLDQLWASITRTETISVLYSRSQTPCTETLAGLLLFSLFLHIDDHKRINQKLLAF